MASSYESNSINRAVIALAAIGLAAVLSITALAFQGNAVPEALSAVAGGAVTALATLLTTFTPSPIPGGRRAVDVVATPTTPAQAVSTAPAEGSNFGGIDIVTGKGTAHG